MHAQDVYRRTTSRVARHSLTVPERSASAGHSATVVRGVAAFEDLGIQMNRHSTLVSYLEKLHDLHGEAMIQRFRGHSRRAQAALRARDFCSSCWLCSIT